MRARPVARASLLALLTVCFAGCAARFESFPFVLADGTVIGMRESPGVGKENEGLLEPKGAGGTTPLYRLVSPADISEDAQALSLLYRSTLADCLLTLYAAEKDILTEVSIPATGDHAYRILVPLAEDSRVFGFRLSTRETGGALKLLGAGTARHDRGFSIRGDEITLDGSVMIRSLGPDTLRARLSAAAGKKMTGNAWTLTVDFRSADAEALRAAFAAAGDSSLVRSFSLSAGPEQTRFVFPAGAVGFLPQELTFSRKDADDGGSTGGPLVSSVLIGFTGEGQPIPADPGIVLRYDRGEWRDPEYEIFSWTRFSGVLIFDTADYGVQDDFFKRLAFFVEKPGYAGTIWDPDELAAKHGWNAHDYRAEDLARFFDVADKKGVPLTAGESELKAILLANRIITAGESGYLGGEGAVISISRESGDALRRQLLTHECFHGVFFSLSEFRDACARAWGALSEVERGTWLLFLESSTYDTRNEYLMINEFQSYLFQQPRDKVEEFQAVVLSRLNAKFPGKSAMLGRFINEHPDSFLRSFDYLDNALRAAGGPPGGEAISVE